MSGATASPEKTRAIPHESQRQVFLLQIVFLVLFLQLQLIVLASLCRPGGIVFVKGYFFGFDLLDFLDAAKDWSAGLNPYLRSRFVTPPPSLLVGMALQHISSATASLVFFAVNLAAVFGSVWMVGRFVKMGRIALFLMLAIASLYYPVVYLLERGNLDGLMLILLCSVVVVRNQWLKGLFLASSVVLKIYSVLLMVPLLAGRRFRLFLLTVLSGVLLLLPFHSLLHPFLQSALSRTQEFTAVENLSPAVVLGSLCKHALGKTIFILFWAATFFRASWRYSMFPLEERFLVCLPWMAAFPLQVYPYSGVLLLPVLAWRLGPRQIAANVVSLRVFLVGFLLVGTQQGALNEYFQSLVHSHRLFPFLNVVGMVLVLTSLAFGGSLPYCKNEDTPTLEPV